MERHALLVAAGSGTRMQENLPKQFLLLDGEPVLLHTLRPFYRAGLELTVVLHPDFMDYWSELQVNYIGVPPHKLVAGGPTRADSVLNGLRSLPPDSICAVHDAVRPLVTPAFILRLYEAAVQYGSAVPVIPLKDSLRKLENGGSEAVPREQYRIVQTPQVFHTAALLDAFAKTNYPTFTDEASIFEAAGHEIHLEPGLEQNLKITVPPDLLLASRLLQGSDR